MKIKQRRKLKKVTNGLFNSFLDLSIFGLAFIGQSYKKDPLTRIINCFQAVGQLNPNSLKRAINNAKYKGYLEKKEDYYKITALGKKRLQRFMPKYEEKRPWDGKLYLITYDIPENQKSKRERLREHLISLGCGMLQHSVWLTPYNPRRLIADYVSEKRLSGLVLVSELSEGSYIGGMKVEDVVDEVYKLDELNKEYRKFCLNIENGKLKGEQIAIQYFAILKKDPQLPFVLLPGNWWGDDAYWLFKKHSRKS